MGKRTLRDEGCEVDVEQLLLVDKLEGAVRVVEIKEQHMQVELVNLLD
jgi:hypothetical protein